MYLVELDIKESSIAGKGYFAKQDIPLGTIIYFYATEDLRYSREQYLSMNIEEKKNLEDNGVENEFGDWVLTAGGPYTNHSCNSNILPLFIQGKYVSIVVKDIKKGDEVTTDYSQFFSSYRWSIDCGCGCTNCRKSIGFGYDIDSKTEDMWSTRIYSAVQKIFEVDQPIFSNTDKYAIEIANILNSLKSNGQVSVGKQIKFSLIKN